MPLLRDLTDRFILEFQRELLMAHRTPPAASIIASEVSTILGEVHACYRAAEADQRAWDSARRPKPCRLAVRRRLQKIVAKKLSANWSPEPIAGWLKQRYPGNQEMQIPHETIYRGLFVQARGVLKKELVGRLRTRRVIRRSKQGHTRGQGRGQIVDAVSPASALPMLRTARFRATGKGIFSRVHTTRIA